MNFFPCFLESSDFAEQHREEDFFQTPGAGDESFCLEGMVAEKVEFEQVEQSKKADALACLQFDFQLLKDLLLDS